MCLGTIERKSFLGNDGGLGFSSAVTQLLLSMEISSFESLGNI